MKLCSTGVIAARPADLRRPIEKKTVATLRDKMDCVESEDVNRVSKPIQANQRLAQIASAI